MKSDRVLKMINDGEIEELKSLLKDEIFKEKLKKLSGTGARNRYSAMKRYFKYADSSNKALCFPFKDMAISIYDGKLYNSFCDGFSLVITPEDIGTIKTYQSITDVKYLDINKLIDLPLNYDVVDINKILAKATEEGYSYNKKELDNYKHKYVFQYKDAFFKMGMLDQAYSIINDGEPAKVYYTGAKGILYIETSVGLCGILPIIMKEESNKTIIESE